MLQKFLTAVIVEEWAKGHAERSSEPLLEKSALARDQGATLLDWLQSEPPIAYHEMVFLLSRLHLDCYNLLHSFVTDCKIGIACIPQLGSEIDPTGTNPACFTVHKAREAVGSMFNTLKNSLGRTKKKELAVISERRNTIAANIDRFHDTKAEYDVRISASFAAAYIALRATPEKVSPIVKGIMNGVKVRFMPQSLHTLIIVAGRGQRRYTDPFCHGSRELCRLLRAIQDQTAAREDRQESVHIPLPRH
jgi:TATA-binding protein-associated factor